MKHWINQIILTLFIMSFCVCYCFGQQSMLNIPLEHYQDNHISQLMDIFKGRIAFHPFNLIATSIFIFAIIHTFLAGYFKKWAHQLEMRHSSVPSFKISIIHFLGEVEAIFGIWALPLLIAGIFYHGSASVLDYLDSLNYNEPFFVVLIMAIASTKPVLVFAEKIVSTLAAFMKDTLLAWWFIILTITPLLGSFITEPAAMTIAALLLSKKFYNLHPSSALKYGTLGLLFVNISVGGTLSHFAAPPVLMVAQKWGFTFSFMLFNIGWKALVGIIAANTFFAILFQKEFKALQKRHSQTIIEKTAPIPFWIICCHMAFLAFTVIFLHHPVVYIGGFLFFLGFMEATAPYQSNLSLKGPLLVGFFLAGLVTHGGLQQWWIEPLLSRLSEGALFFGSVILTSFNDNAAITYLASLVPSFNNNIDLQIAVVEGAVTGGGLTVIANAPNPAGQSILSRHFQSGVSPIKLFLGALVPTLILIIVFRLI